MSRPVAAILVTALAACAPEPLSALTSRIEIADPDEPRLSLCATDFVADCAYDFGEVAVGRTAQLSFLVNNPSHTALAIRSFAVEGSAHFALVDEAPTFVDAEAGRIVTVLYTPDAEGAESASVVIVSDAQNAATVTIELSAHGVTLGGPVLAIEPGSCDFGAVGVGVRAVCTLSLRNDGVTPLTLTDLSFSASTPSPEVFGFDVPVGTPAIVQPGTALTASFYGTPASLAESVGTLVVTSDDPTTPTAYVPFVVSGSQAPTAVARVKSVNGAPTATSQVEPLDDVVLSGDQSAPGTGAASIASFQWTIIEKPPESSIELSAAASADTGFVFSSSLGDTAGVDVAGTFRVRLVVTDSNGGVSSNDAIVTLSSVPTEGLHVQLTWSASSNDLDLHLGKGFGVDWCSQDDCYYGNCADNHPPNWDVVAGFTDGDPQLDIDDTNGFGPENIHIETPIDESYVIGVHAYSGEGGGAGFTPTDVTAKVFVGGALVDTFNGHLEAKNEFWRVARVNVNGGITITSVDTTQPNTPTGCE